MYALLGQPGIIGLDNGTVCKSDRHLTTTFLCLLLTPATATAGETFLIIDRFRWLVASVHLAHIWNGKLRVILLAMTSALWIDQSCVVKAFHALLPGLVVQLVQVLPGDIGKNRLIDCDWQIASERSAACSMIQRWSISKAVRNTAFSSSDRKSRC